ncbi:high affinity copper uptake protein 1 isoform X2 [Cephus cinctus]|uniref:Copper transport protein n=1 Tax=Cephus cinctus TaxID=211228 RepID=A0AAJ7BG88_CEPCN|nr:high affinity copper uptake protein 1 isoform X2 [Cephus cinctus]
MMNMAFHTGLSETILFKGWVTSDWTGIIGSMVGIALMAAIYEGLKNYREHLYANSVCLRKAKIPASSALCSSVHILQTLLHMIQLVISYFLMLIFMTYNVWLCIALIAGTGCGYFLFGWSKSNNEMNECCH